MTIEIIVTNLNAFTKHAQGIYLAVFNNAWDEYKDPEDRCYEKAEGKWKKKIKPI